MEIETPAAWPLTESAALDVQAQLRGLVRRAGSPAVRMVAGVDVAYDKETDLVAAAVVVLDADTLVPVEEQVAIGVARFPYIPGLFAFRELPTLVEALRRVETHVDVLICDGYGIAHPRRFGLASHLGVLAKTPSIGVGKTAFVGQYGEPAAMRGAYTDLIDGGEIVGRVLRTQRDVRPVFVSIGHAIGLDTACDLVIGLSPRYRLPEPIRAADHLSRTTLAAAREPSL